MPAIVNQGEVMDKVLQAIADQASLAEACRAAGVSVGAHYHWLKTDHPYSEGYKLAVQIRARGLEDTLNRRAVEGYDEIKTTYTVITDPETGAILKRIPVEQIVVRKIDNGLALRMLAANDEHYNPKLKVEKDLSRASIAEILAGARKRVAAGRGEESPDADDSEESNEAEAEA